MIAGSRLLLPATCRYFKHITVARASLTGTLSKSHIEPSQNNTTKTPTQHPQITTMSLNSNNNNKGAEGIAKSGTSMVSPNIKQSHTHTTAITNKNLTARQRSRRHHKDCWWNRWNRRPRSRRHDQQHHRHQGCRRWTAGFDWWNRECR